MQPMLMYDACMYVPLVVSLRVLMIFAAYSTRDVLCTAFFTILKAPLQDKQNTAKKDCQISYNQKLLQLKGQHTLSSKLKVFKIRDEIFRRWELGLKKNVSTHLQLLFLPLNAQNLHIFFQNNNSLKRGTKQ